jgi:hypothetical protein
LTKREEKEQREEDVKALREKEKERKKGTRDHFRIEQRLKGEKREKSRAK